MCAQMNFPGFDGSTSSQESADGQRRSASPGGQQTSRSGPAAPHASLSASPGKDSAKMIPGTSPPTLRGWSGLGAPSCCLANRSPAQTFSARFQRQLTERLQQRLHGHGAMIYKTVWKVRVTPMGRQICALRASALRTLDSVSFSALFAGMPSGSSVSGWPTTTVTDGLKQGVVSPRPGMMGLSETAPLAGWPTSRAADGAKNVRSVEGTAREMKRKGGPQDLQMASTLAGWATASARDWKDSPGMATVATNPDGSTRNRVDQLPRQALLAGWPTASASDGSGGGQAKRAHNPERSNDLNDFAMLAGWPTTGAADATRGSPETPQQKKARGAKTGTSLIDAASMCAPARLTASGEMLTGSTAQMESGGQLRPGHSRWLMGYQAAWYFCGAMAMQSIRGSRRRSSRPSKPSSTRIDLFG